MVWTGCSTTAHRERADDAVYKIVADVEEQIFGDASDFTIATAYTERNPDDISVEEIFKDRNLTARRAIGIDEGEPI